MDSSTITATTFTLTGWHARLRVVTYNTGTSTATFTPNSSLAYKRRIRQPSPRERRAPRRPLASNYVWTFTTGANPNQVTVDFGTTYQTIRGFGGSTAWLGALSTAQATACSTASVRARTQIERSRPQHSAGAHRSHRRIAQDDWVTSNWAQELTNAQEAMTANTNAIVFASPWTPPPSMKSNNSTVEGTLNTSEYGAYAAYLEDFVSYFASNSAPCTPFRCRTSRMRT